MDPRLKILLSTAGILVAGGLLAIIIVAAGGSKSDTTGKAKIVLETTSFDFGDVSMANGKVTKTISIKNEGDADLKISKMSTSCMCTTAALEIDGKKSPAFGMPGHGGPSLPWTGTIPAGKTGMLELVFDPNAHGPDATGPIKRTINITSNDSGEKGSVNIISFEGNVIK
ncbi:MAG: DUF1573 domain-containing protein [Patescibacteria group bacterium]